MQKAILKQSVIELYNRWNITWDTDVRKLKPTDFPVFSDLHKLISDKADEDKAQSVCRDLALRLNDISFGNDSFLWNGRFYRRSP